MMGLQGSWTCSLRSRSIVPSASWSPVLNDSPLVSRMMNGAGASVTVIRNSHVTPEPRELNAFSTSSPSPSTKKSSVWLQPVRLMDVDAGVTLTRNSVISTTRSARASRLESVADFGSGWTTPSSPASGLIVIASVGCAEQFAVPTPVCSAWTVVTPVGRVDVWIALSKVPESPPASPHLTPAGQSRPGESI